MIASPDRLPANEERLSANEIAKMAKTDLGVTRFVAECDLPTAFGDFRLRAYRSGVTEPTVVVKGNVTGENVLVRVHDQVSTKGGLSLLISLPHP